MNAPFYDFGGLTVSSSLLFALVVGVAFGFFLERAGLGNAQKLAGQFYMRDLTVFKVMFTAIITAMLGVYWLSWLGLLQADMLFLTPTFLWPQLGGGLVFGLGFILGGYCPGTSCVASASGSLDGLVHVAGMLAGILLFGQLFPWLESFYTSGEMGAITLPELSGLPRWLVVAVVIGLALLAFGGAEQVERKARS